MNGWLLLIPAFVAVFIYVTPPCRDPECPGWKECGKLMEPEEDWEEGADAAADRYESDMYKQFER